MCGNNFLRWGRLRKIFVFKVENIIITNHIARRAGLAVQQRIDQLGIGQKMQDLPEELWHASFRFYVKEDPTRKGGPNLRMIRLDPKKPSLTVTGYIFNKFVHPFENRFITVREAARLQGFPDSVTFKGSLTSTQIQIGNAVPVPLAKAVFKSVLQSAKHLGFNNDVLTGLSLFSGSGGTDIGAEETSYDGLRIDTKVAMDKWLDACNTLQGFYGTDMNVLHQDILQIEDPLTFWRETLGANNPPDVIHGGPPCQVFSQAGKQKGTVDERGQLVFEFLRFVQQLMPPFFIMENVANIKGVGGGLLYSRIMEHAHSLGYNVTVATLLAADFGAPQLRQRLFFLGCRNDIGTLLPPEPTHHEFPTLFSQPFITVGQSFAGLPKAIFSGKSSELATTA